LASATEENEVGDAVICNGATGLAVPIPTYPALLTTNFVNPLLLAVKISPEPDWSTIAAALVVAPENEAIGAVATLPRTSRVDKAFVVPMPTLPKLSIIILVASDCSVDPAAPLADVWK